MNQTALTEQILEFWRTDDSFRKSLQERSTKRSFRFYDGPPFTSGDPHYGHLLQSTVKDMVPRWMTMRGYHVDRKRGWDCHGIPAENFVNKQLGITSKKQVESEYGVGPYVEECRKMVNQVNDNRKWFVDHVGRWVDMDNAYFTMDNDFMESVIWVFSDLYNKNLIYKGFKVLGYSRALGTALSASEIAEGYEDRQDPAVTVRFKVQSSDGSINHLMPTQVVCAIITNEQGAYLMEYDTRIGNWMFPGGKMEAGETKEEALTRELKEELGVEVVSQSFHGSIPYVHKNKVFLLHYIDATISGTPQNLEPEKHSDIKRVGKIAHDNAFGFAIKIENTLIDDEDQIQQDFVDFLNLEKGIIGNTDMADAPIYFLAWTTTPWTLPSNMFLAVNSKLTYVQIYHKESNCYYILAKNLLSKTFKNPAEYVVIYQMKGKELLGLRYQPIFPYIQNARGKMQDNFYRHSEGNETKGSVIEESFGEHTGDPSTSSGGPRDNKEHNTKNDQGTGYIDKMFQVLDADFVTDDAGTGIAHEAPAFGELDYNLVAGFLGRETAAEWLFNPVDDNGEFTAEVAEWEGMNVITASTEITKFLKHRGDIIKHETINHSYPHCPRTGTPLIYRAMESRFVKEDQLKAQSVPLAETINFVPPSVKNRFVEGLKSAPDWNISRSRYWGAPLPVWISENGQGDPLVLGNREEIYQWSKTGSKNIEKQTGENGLTIYWDTFTNKQLDLHRPYIDNIRFMKDGVRYNRIPEVLDCWFESGSMPYGQEKYKGVLTPNPSPSEMEEFNPTANFIAEGLDQTRGWFRSLHVLGTATFTKPIFENVVVTGMILAEDGKKMSKSKKNFPDPKGLLEQYGPDAFRLYLLSSPVVRSEPLRFKEKDVEQVLKDVLLPLHNIVNFFSTYAKVDNYKNPGTEVYFMRHASAGNQTENTSSGELAETERTKETPLNEVGLQQIQSEKFIEEIGRVMPDIILSSNFTRAIQTAEGAQKVLKDIYGKDLELIIDTTEESGSEMIARYQQIYPHKTLLVVGHSIDFKDIWKNYVLERKIAINNTEIIKLPLVPLKNELDQWMYSELYTLIGQLDQELAGYRLDSATKLLLEFIEKLSNRYLRRSRRRFRANGMDADKLAAYHTLYEVMTTYLKLLAPFAPFTTEYLWKGLQDFSSVGDKNRSIHLEYRPLPGNKYINAELMDEIKTVRTIIKQALFVRAKNQIKVKIPLKTLSFKIS